MPKSYIINGLDIGSGSIKLISVLKKPGELNFEVLYQDQAESFGVRRGVVVDTQKTAEIISLLVAKMEQNCGQKISNIYASVGGGHIFCSSSRGLVSVSRADRKISEEDIERVLQAAQTFSLSSNKEILEVVPKEFIVDGEGKIKEAVGLEGVRLEADILAVCGFSPYLKNSTQAIFNSGLHLNDLIPTALASARAVLTPREKESGVCVLDIGAGTTSMAVFEEGSLIHTAVFPVGSAHITSDIAVCLKTDLDTAEKIKLEFGSCGKPFFPLGKKRDRKEEKKIKVEAEEPLIFSRKALREIIGTRVSEIFNLAGKDLKKISRQGNLPAGIILTGGGSKMAGIRDLARKELKLPCRIGAPINFPAGQQDPSFSTVCGLVLEGAELEEEGNVSGFGNMIKEKIRKLLRIFIP